MCRINSTFPLGIEVWGCLFRIAKVKQHPATSAGTTMVLGGVEFL